MNLTTEEKKILLECARQSINTHFGRSFDVEPDNQKYPALQIPAGAFVTLRIYDNQLRGCVGFIEAKTNMFDTVKEAARYAAFHDSRFQPVNEEEMPFISIEISVLSSPVKMNSYDDIIVGTHGLILEDMGRRALLLPQVPIEHNLDKDEFLSALCEKAGLYKNTWKEHELNIYLFTATIFSEEE